MRAERVVLWPDREDVFLTTYIHDDSSEYPSGRRRPAVVVCPGGAYLGLSDREGEPVALQFAAAGYHAFVLNYSTFFGGNMAGNFDIGATREGNPHAAFPGPLLDLGKAMLTIRANAGRWLVDADQVAVCGFSAGGHLAASLGVHWPDLFLAEALGAANHDFRPAGLILCYALTDYLVMKRSAELIRKADPRLIDLWHLSNLAVFQKPEPSLDELNRVSTVNHVSEQTPPAFIWHTADDDLVPVSNAFHFAAALVEKGVPCELHVFENGPHGLGLADAGYAGKPEQVNEPVRIWLQLAIAWLGRHLPLA
jgi:acetyl esterase/lipase